MHPAQSAAGSHAVEQLIDDARLELLVDQVVDQSCAAVTVLAAFGKVRDQRRAVAETQMTALQALCEAL